MECPRCGAGVGHTDNQCWRCGEMLKPAKGGESIKARSSGPAISAVKEGTTVIKRPLAPTVVRSLNDHNDAREKDLRGMEEELVRMDVLDADSKELDEAIHEYEEERVDFERRKDLIQIKEEELEGRALALGEAIKSIEGFINGTRSGKRPRNH